MVRDQLGRAELAVAELGVLVEVTSPRDNLGLDLVRGGGDGFVCARTLRERGYQVRLALSCKPEELRADPKEMARRWDETIEPLGPRSLEGAE